MKFHVYAINWNEERLLPLFFRHYRQADKIFIMDNHSTDQSKSIIEAHGGVIIPFETKNTLNDTENMRQKNKVWKQSKGEADFVIVQDLDEFLFFPEHPNDICAGLAAAHARGTTIIQCRGVQMFSTDAAFDQIRADSSQHITTALWNGTIHEPCGNYDKCIAFNPNLIDKIGYNVGAHKAYPEGHVVIDEKCALLLHYKFVGYEYLFERYKVIRERLSIENKGQHWGKQYDQTDKELEVYLNNIFKKHQSESLFSIMYPNNMIAPFQYKGRRCVISTFGNGDYISRAILQGATWEPIVAEFIHSVCATNPRTTLFLDIGSNIGVHTAVARLAGVKQIHAFECNPTTYAKISETVRLNGWSDVKVWNTAVSDKKSEYSFKVVPDNIGASYIENTHKGWPGATQAGGTVRSIDIDSLKIDLSGIEKVVVKMDVEGHELQAIRGMRDFLSKPVAHHFILEINPVCSDVRVIQEELDLLESCGFRLSFLLFKVPGYDWAGKELTQLPQLTCCSREDIFSLFAQNHVMEVSFTK